MENNPPLIRPGNSPTWTTEDELIFLAHLGEYTPINNPTKLSRSGYLNGYILSLDLRVDWGKIDATRIRRAAERMFIDAMQQEYPETAFVGTTDGR